MTSDTKPEDRINHGVIPRTPAPPPLDHIMQFFAYEHLPQDLREISAPFHSLAEWVVRTIPRNPERTVALRKLLEAKDAAVRAYVCEQPRVHRGGADEVSGD